MVSVPAGSFSMGSASGGEADEKPVHTVTVSGFKLDKHEVTNAEYNRCVNSGKCKKAHYTDGRCMVWSNGGLRKIKTVPMRFREDDKPVVCVSWQQARAYCRSQGKRLPTEAEWEKAATGSGQRSYSVGSISTATVNYNAKETTNVGSFTAGSYGLKDMNGNVWEWVHDRYERDYYKYSEKKDPKGPPVSRFRVIRGGGFYSDSKKSRSRNRHWFAPEAGEVSIGFRCAK